MAEEVETWTTRKAAHYLNLSTVALVRKVKLLKAIRRGREYRWPVEQIKNYERAVKDKELTDPTRGAELRD